MSNDLFNMVITMDVSSPTDPQFHSAYTVQYDNMSYASMQAVQEAVANALLALGAVSAE